MRIGNLPNRAIGSVNSTAIGKALGKLGAVIIALTKIGR